MWPGTGIIGIGSMCGSVWVGLFHDTQQLFSWLGVFLGQPRDLDAAIFIFHDIEDVFLVEQI